MNPRSASRSRSLNEEGDRESPADKDSSQISDGGSMNNNNEQHAEVQTASGCAERMVLQDTIAAADLALQKATRIQGGVQDNLALHQQVSSLQEELRHTRDEAERYRDMHAKMVKMVLEMQARETRHAAQFRVLQAENENLLIRRRIYKLLAEYYGFSVLHLDMATLIKQRERILQHLLDEKQKGRSILEVGVAEIIPPIALEVLQLE